MNTPPPILYTSKDGVAEIRFNRPDQLNVLDVEMAEAFAESVDCAVADRSIRALVISSEGRAFMAGGDLSHFRSSADKSLAAIRLIRPMHGALRQLATADFISIGSLRGPVAGGGMSLALNLDLLIAADDATFNLAYARIGASPDCGGSWALPRLVGYRRALEIALLSETIGGAEALDLGIVSRIVPLPDLQLETLNLAKRIASGAPLAQARIKALMRASFENSYQDQLDAEAKNFAECAATQDFSEAVEAFFDRRKPVFRGT